VSRIDGASLANQETRDASEEQIRSAHLVAELLDEINQCPEKFANANWTSEFIEHATNTLFNGKLARLAKYLGNKRILNNCRYLRRPISLPLLTTIAGRCGCKISDVVLRQRVKIN
jgi:hypothetical protein